MVLKHNMHMKDKQYHKKETDLLWRPFVCRSYPSAK